MQRCGFMFSQEVPNDPDGYRYVWHSNHRGRIMLERVRLPEGQDAWLFSRGTLAQPRRPGRRPPRHDSRPALRDDRRGDRRGRAGRRQRREGAAAAGRARRSWARPARRCARSSSRWTSWSSTAISPRSSWPASTSARSRRRTAAGIGLRLAAKLEAVLHRLGVDLMTVADTWEADPLILGRDTEWQVTLARGKDGAWRFDRETVSRVPDLFERLTPDEKSAREHRSNFHSAQQTMRTLLHASDAGDLDLAARCLDLDGVPQGARAELGPILAYKLKFVLDRIGRVVVEEIPSEADGPRYYYHRSTLGRIDLVKCAEGTRRGDWQFSRETVAQIEAMFRAAFDRRLAPGLSPRQGHPRGPLACGWSPRSGSGAGCPPGSGAPRRDSTSTSGSAWPSPWRACGMASWLGLRVLERVACHALRRGGFVLDRAVVAPKLRPLAFQLGLWCLYLQIRLLDLPSAVVGVTIPALKIAWIGLMGWTAFRLIDLGMILYGQSERLHDRRSLSDMIVPTAANGLKLAVLVAGRLVSGLPDRQP